MEKRHSFRLEQPLKLFSMVSLRKSNSQVVLIGARSSTLIAQFEPVQGNMKWCVYPIPLIRSKNDQRDQSSKIIAIDAINAGDSAVIFMTSSDKSRSDPSSQNPYTLTIAGANSSEYDDWSRICNDRQLITLNYQPLGIFHTNIRESNEPIILICGNDTNIRAYEKIVTDGKCKYQATDIGSHFPELTDVPESILCIDTLLLESMRASAIGGQEGYISLTIEHDGELIQHSAVLDGPISSIKLFQNGNVINLIVGAPIGYCLLYQDVLTNGLSNVEILENSDRYDSVLKVDVRRDIRGDINILVGTYGQKVLIYRKIAKVQPKTREKLGKIMYEYKLTSVISFPYPVFGILNQDFTGDGFKDLVVSSMYSVHLLQIKMEEVNAALEARLKLLQEIEQLENK
eukprot:TRINITY_DN5736_c0_g1_i2.p1 TRINITY_DN5736_c0_g1~~TRINITY_DN5736_c0_g1_i2.p1  ORF type:complete len:401 (-),score=92.00 TRINITY_DN5736_c0_g1_i2:39-1241(-)